MSVCTLFKPVGWSGLLLIFAMNADMTFNSALYAQMWMSKLVMLYCELSHQFWEWLAM